MAARWKRKWSTGRTPQNHTTVHVQGDAPNHQTEQQWQDPASHSAQAPTQQLSPPSWELLPSLPHPPVSSSNGRKSGSTVPSRRSGEAHSTPPRDAGDADGGGDGDGGD